MSDPSFITMTRRPDWSYLRTPLRAIQWLVLLVLAINTLAIALVASGRFPGRLFVVESGSMGQTMPVGSLILTRPGAPYSTGDIITFRAPGHRDLVTHRVLGVSTDASGPLYQTKGDANETADPWTIPLRGVTGQVIFTVPLMGYLFAWSQTPVGTVFLILLPALGLFFWELWNLVREWGRWRQDIAIRETVRLF